MSASDRAARDAFVELADTLVAEFDIIDFLNTLATRAVKLLDVATCGVVLVDHHDTLSVVAASTEQTRLLELLELQNVEGPSLDCYRTGRPVSCANLAEADARWPQFAPNARDAGFAAVEAVPMRLRSEVIGAMNLFSRTSGEADQDTRDLARALADVATIGILHERAVRRREVLAEQLQNALHSRILIEQAKGVLAERHSISVSDGFKVMQRFSRDNNRRLATVAQAVVDGDLLLAPWDEPPQADR